MTKTTVTTSISVLFIIISSLIIPSNALLSLDLTVNLTVESADMSGTTFSGQRVELLEAGIVIQEGFTPFSASILSGIEYEVFIYDDPAESKFFDHWEDGSTNARRAITLTEDTILTAFFQTDTTSGTETSNNSPPIASDDSASTNKNSAVTINVLANDTDPDDNQLSVTSVSIPSNGSATINADNTITYTPNQDFIGTDSFEYQVSDGNGGTDTALVSITINEVDTTANDTDIASDDTAEAVMDNAVTIDKLKKADSRSPSVPPTLGVDQNNKRIVENGFSYNGSPTDVENHYTNYPLVITEVGKENVAALKIYNNLDNENIVHVGLAFGLAPGQIFNDSMVSISWDKTFDGREKISTHDPENVLDNVRITTEEVKCGATVLKCLHFKIYHTFRAPLDFTMVSTYVWDSYRNAQQNYFNDGLKVVGESLNPPKKHTGIYQGHLISLTEVEKNKAVDEDGNMWTFDKSWEMDFVPKKGIIKNAIAHSYGKNNTQLLLEACLKSEYRCIVVVDSNNNGTCDDNENRMLLKMQTVSNLRIKTCKNN